MVIDCWARMMDYDWAIDAGYVPETIIRFGTRRIQQAQEAAIAKRTLTEAMSQKLEYVAKLRSQPIAIQTTTANEQQYEIGTGVFEAFLGPRMKYSCSLFQTGQETIAEAETAMLQTYASRAEFKNGMSILDLGCGWGSATLFFAEQYPASRVTGLSNSRTQKDKIVAEAAKRNLTNVEIITGDIAEYNFEPEQFDRVVSVELFEHMKNYELLMAKVATSLKPGGKLFVQIFCHNSTPYDFDEGWMSRYFFAGGTMPSADLLLYFQRDLQIQKQWWVNGSNYARTLQCWLSALRNNKQQVWPHLVETYGESNASSWYNRWLAYHAAGSELFGFGGGDVSGTCHYLFGKPE
ncbi:putative secondary metabolism biosynthetic enzyme [Purpureocillium takamizusanense]|uniref:Secondary metabolism biosynthetic enzyme n=1 Tax=Purpureocillium takamizusanense TaxID=2060973 RepID=A0A9Q8Q935_9HYPO|nr:putative secondary metabolism biosynthetic enzyme [Purpureocillium takamizusanense]UNI15300.1 putative secondary metabolism biosynthetic enzyme [Purpureocillium takamizusanense]